MVSKMPRPPLFSPGPTHLATLLQQHLIILAERNAEDDGRDILETVNPLLPLTPLTSHIEHARWNVRLVISILHRQLVDLLHTELAHLEASFVDTRGFGSRSENVVLVWEVIFIDNACSLAKETKLRSIWRSNVLDLLRTA